MTLNPEEWRRVREVFEGALARPEAERDSFVTAASNGDAALRRRVEALLDAHLSATDFLETPPLPAVAQSASDVSAASASPDLTGTQLGPYRLLARIGIGGMGEVYRGQDTRLDRLVAVKVLPSQLANDEAARQRFEREARAVAALNHPHICTLHDIGAGQTGAGRLAHFFVMELLDGETLADRLTRGALPVAQALEYARQIGSALAAAHGVGLVHRDLKPSNVMLASSGAKLLDFGVAKAAASVLPGSPTLAPGTDLTAPGMIVGTLHYMSPEQLEGLGADARSDIFSFGCVLYEMLSGRKAFDGRSAASVMTAIMASEPAPLRSLSAAVPASVERLVTTCLAKDPSARWASITLVLDALARAATESTPPRGRPRAMRAAAPLLVLALAAGVWYATSRSAPPPQVSTPHLAVLPLRVVGDPSGQERHLGVAIADAIITRLATVRQIRLRPTAAVLGYAEAPIEPGVVAKALEVDHVLVGTIQSGSRAYRVSVQLVRSATGAIGWARTYDVAVNDLLTLQDTIAEQVVAALALELTAAERERLQHRYTENVAAYDLYLRGRASFVNYTESGMKAAIDAFERALAIDPDYALARAGLAVACAWFSIRYAYEADAREWGARAERESRAALASDPNLAEATLATASAAGTLYGGFDWAAVIDGATRALALDPTLELAHVVRMRAFFHLGLFERMGDEARAARQMNPLGNVEIARLEVAAQLFSGAYERARDQAAALLARSDAPVIQNYRGLAQFYAGDAAAARTTLAAVQRGGRPDIRSQASLAGVEAASGLATDARARARQIEAGPYMDHHVAYSLGAAWAQLGDAAQAVKWFQQAADGGFPCFPWLSRDPLVDPIRKSPAFVALAQSLQQRYERDRQRYQNNP